MKKIFGVIIIGVLCLFVVLVKFYGSRSVGATSDKLVVGVMSGYEPYAIVNEKGQLEGFDIDVANSIGQKLKKQVVFKDMSLSALVIALQQNKIDLLISGFSITPEREKQMAMIYYQGIPTTSYPLVFWKNIPEGITTIRDLKNNPNAVVCVEPGSVQEKFLLQFDFLQLKTMGVISEIVMDLKYGKSFAALLDPDILPTLKQQVPELVSIDIQLPKEYQSKGVGIAINKKNNDLTQKVAVAVKELRQDGSIPKLENQWFTQNGGNE